MEIVAFDLETTGLDPKTDSILEIGAVRFISDGTVLGRFESLVRSDRESSPGAFAAHGIGPEMIATAPSPEVVIPEFLDWIGDGIPVLAAHNLDFDLPFLRRAASNVGRTVPVFSPFCTLRASRSRWKHLHSRRLGDVADFLGLPDDIIHRAAADAERVRMIWLALHNGKP